MTSSVAPKKERRGHVTGSRARQSHKNAAPLLPTPTHQAKPYLLTLHVAELPKTLNSLLGARWQIRAGHAKKWERMIWRLVWPIRPPKPLAKAKLTLVRSSSRALDYEGLVGSFKAPIDALVKNGIIEDDSVLVIGQPTYLHEVGKRGGGFIKIQVEEV